MALPSLSLSLSLFFGSLLCGLIAGIIAGMFGVGGGIIVVPVLLLLFHLNEIHPDIIMQLAVGTSLATIIITNLSATWNHHRRQSVQWHTAGHYTPGCLLGAWLGSKLATLMSGSLLILLFGLFEIYVGLKMIRSSTPTTTTPTPLPKWLTSTIGIGIGGLSALFGIGGGTLSVPALTLLSGLPMTRAVGTSSAIGIPLAVAGTLGFIQAGWQVNTLPPDAVGFVLPTAFFGIATGSLLTTPLGVRLAHAMDPAKLKKGFGFFLLIVGIKLLLK
ncbi:MAG: sulfite exporter TauE/SafE family protein [Magnetococcales bacterium]|nr:sulfite exporter TauE/SafE family protein [Magnetococcales bacterium]NGZ07058.1 sulfite exporter TauE/SafE family protein [Magnetococcales bacterium]